MVESLPGCKFHASTTGEAVQKAYAEAAVPFSPTSSLVSIGAGRLRSVDLIYTLSMLEGNLQRSLVYSFLKVKLILPPPISVVDPSLFLTPQSTYFDSVISHLCKWPSLDLPTVSVVLDPRDASLAPVASSPDISVIIFDLYQLETFASSALLKRTDAFRLRLPGCELARFLCRNPGSLPSMTFLDASTSHVSVADVNLMLRSLPNLRHLVLDGCGTLDEASIDDWVDFGHDCFMINNGVKLEEVENERFASQSLTSLEPESTASPPIVGSTLGVSIIPSVSNLRTITLSVPPNADVNAQQDLTAAFQRGWDKAMTEYNERLHAAHQGRSRGWRVIRFAKPDEIGHLLGHSGYYRMAIVDDDGFAQLNKVKGDEDRPVVCLAGKLKTEGGIGHAEGCGHMIGRDVWEDAM